jgi:hypothetical protein
MQRTCLTFLTVFLAATAVVAGVSVDYDRSADFPAFKTFAFKEGTPADNPFVQERIEAAIRRELEAKGLKMVEGDADLNVVTHVAVTVQTRVDVSGYGGRYRSWGTATAHVSEIPIGNLMIDLVNASADQLVWRGIGSGTVSKKPEKSEKKINKVVGKLFKDFPPGME